MFFSKNNLVLVNCVHYRNNIDCQITQVLHCEKKAEDHQQPLSHPVLALQHLWSSIAPSPSAVFLLLLWLKKKEEVLCYAVHGGYTQEQQ